MCGVQDSLQQISPRGLNLLNNIKKESSNDVRKEKSRDAARFRRAKESDYFQELSELLPVHGTPPNSQMTNIDKTSLIRLSVAYLKTRDFIQQLPNNCIKEEVGMEMDVEEAVNGFSLALNQEQDIVHVSNNVNNFIGLTSFELLGMPFSDFVHPCDHQLIRDLLPDLQDGEDKHVKAYLRVKCTITDRGRLINLKQASYKSVRVEGRVRRLKEKEEGGLAGLMFLGVCSLVSADMALDTGPGIVETKHSTDFKFVETDAWLADIAGYDRDKLQERSLLELVHAQDTATIQAAFTRLVDHGHCETGVWRLLVAGGGHVHVQTRAAFIAARKGSSKGNIFHCKHSILTEILEAGVVESLIQLECRREPGSQGDSPRRPTTAAAAGSVWDTARRPANRAKKAESKPAKQERMGADNINDILQMLNQDAEELKQHYQITIDNQVQGITELKNDDENEDKQTILEKSTKSLAQDSNQVYDDLLMLSDDEMDDRCNLKIELADVQRSRNSVIVRPTPCAVTSSLFTFPEQEMKNESALSDPYGSPAYSATGTSSGSSPQLQFPSGLTEVPINSMFGNFLSSELEKLSPFIGEETIPLSKQDFDYQGFEALGCDYLDDLEFPDTVLNFNANTEKVFSQDYGFAEEGKAGMGEGKDANIVRSSTDLMWGSPQAEPTCGADQGQKFPGVVDEPSMVLMVPVVDGSGLHEHQNKRQRSISEEQEHAFQPIKGPQNQKGPDYLVPLTSPVDHAPKDPVFQILDEPTCGILDPGDILNTDQGAIKIIPLENPLRPPGSAMVQGQGLQGTAVVQGQGLQGTTIRQGQGLQATAVQGQGLQGSSIRQGQGEENSVYPGQGLKGTTVLQGQGLLGTTIRQVPQEGSTMHQGQGLQGNANNQGNAVFQDPGLQGNVIMQGPGIRQLLLEPLEDPRRATVETSSQVRPIQGERPGDSNLSPPPDRLTRGQPRPISLQRASVDRAPSLQRDSGQRSVIKHPPGYNPASLMNDRAGPRRGSEGYAMAPSWDKGGSVSAPASAGTYHNNSSDWKRESVLMNLLAGNGSDYIPRPPLAKDHQRQSFAKKRAVESDAEPGGRPAPTYRQSAAIATGYRQSNGEYRHPNAANGQHAASGYYRAMNGDGRGYKMAAGGYRQPAIKRRSVDYSHLDCKSPRIDQSEAINQRASLGNQQASISNIRKRDERQSTDQLWGGGGAKSPIAVESGIVIPVSPECAAMLDFGDSYATAASQFQAVMEEV